VPDLVPPMTSNTTDFLRPVTAGEVEILAEPMPLPG
jgi:hypothetical protein